MSKKKANKNVWLSVQFVFDTTASRKVLVQRLSKAMKSIKIPGLRKKIVSP